MTGDIKSNRHGCDRSLCVIRSVAENFASALIFGAVLVLFSLKIFVSDAFAAQPFELHLLDVGQGQGILVEADGQYMLIDGGGRESSSYVISYLRQQGIENLDFIAVSHYDEDHMSGVIGALNVFPVKMLLVPSYRGEGDLYQSFATAALSNGTVIYHPQAGEKFQLGGALVEVVGPVRTDYEAENDRSLALKVTYGNLSCLICGDAEQQGETDMVDAGYDLSANVYVANHHGSKSSSSERFLDAISPSYALISCGRDNSYGHPAQETLQRFQDRGVEIYRTDLQGTVILSCDGSSFWFSQDPCQDWTPGTYQPQGDSADSFDYTDSSDSSDPSGSPDSSDSSGSFDQQARITYVINTNTRKFHYPTCNSVLQMKQSNRMDTDLSREDLIAQGYEPCGNCRP